ncbi:hypothetical protein [Seonamhaeicola aphaedonensis]|uniref:DUF4258 domain-containing protein n=1 Tax=Seonamhaeicola aphaedonensis TaxID=1461338 RepID=A0A3D9HJ48_9FLAO|nr:hypothetical protein [Seonamhaeicola aphaedonensis]RED49510.1 hypothetical protein DFQ02_102284 [Seonamhaeicola aphaedonensis]
MKFIQRLGYYLGGFSIGLIVLAFFLNGKQVSCDYGPKARVLKNINSKPINYTQTFISDSSTIKQILQKGNIDFSKSNPRQEPCGNYFIEGKHNDYLVSVVIKNCDSIVTVLDFKEVP